jgi:hypothetical protein
MIDTPDPPVAPTDCLTATYAGQEANLRRPVRLSTPSLAAGFAWQEQRRRRSPALSPSMRLDTQVAVPAAASARTSAHANPIGSCQKDKW